MLVTLANIFGTRPETVFFSNVFPFLMVVLGTENQRLLEYYFFISNIGSLLGKVPSQILPGILFLSHLISALAIGVKLVPSLLRGPASAIIPRQMGGTHCMETIDCIS